MKTIAVALLAVLLLARGSCNAEDFSSFHENVLGTSLELRIRADSSGAASRAEQLALLEIDRLSKIFSSYDASSEFSKFQSLPTGSAMPVSNELYETMQQCDQWTRISRGAFNPGVEQLSRQC